MKVVLWIAVCMLVPGIAQETAEHHRDPTRGSKNVSQVVAFPIEDVMEAARKAVRRYGCDIKKESRGYLECTRSREIGVFVGSGGEKVKVRLSKKRNGTLVKIDTGKGFVGRLGKKNWSTPIFNAMVKTLEKGKKK